MALGRARSKWADEIDDTEVFFSDEIRQLLYTEANRDIKVEFASLDEYENQDRFDAKLAAKGIKEGITHGCLKVVNRDGGQVPKDDWADENCLQFPLECIYREKVGAPAQEPAAQPSSLPPQQPPGMRSTPSASPITQPQPPSQPPSLPPSQPPSQAPRMAPGQAKAPVPAQPPVQAPCRPPSQPPGQPLVQPPGQPPVQPPIQPPMQALAQPPLQPPAQPPVQPPLQPPLQAPVQPPANPNAGGAFEVIEEYQAIAAEAAGKGAVRSKRVGGADWSEEDVGTAIRIKNTFIDIIEFVEPIEGVSLARSRSLPAVFPAQVDAW